MEEILNLYEYTKDLPNAQIRLEHLKTIRIKLLEILINPDLSKVEKKQAKEFLDLILISLN